MAGGIEIVLGDITEQVVDAIVNAANESLLGGGGRGRRHPPRRRSGDPGRVPGCSAAARRATRRRRRRARCRRATSCTRSAPCGAAASAASLRCWPPATAARSRSRPASAVAAVAFPADLDRRLRLSGRARRGARDRGDARGARQTCPRSRSCASCSSARRPQPRSPSAGYERLMASAIARTCSGVEPQQPPTTRAPAARSRARPRRDAPASRRRRPSRPSCAAGRRSA